ncbi:hypothetical protein J4558_16280 [Leptolyngbya sp. 15MV]|nr:hypothetical protein J4558_16280 [Leptolyngbya sp. 15MV]
MATTFFAQDCGREFVEFVFPCEFRTNSPVCSTMSSISAEIVLYAVVGVFPHELVLNTPRN